MLEALVDDVEKITDKLLADARAVAESGDGTFENLLVAEFAAVLWLCHRCEARACRCRNDGEPGGSREAQQGTLPQPTKHGLLLLDRCR